MAVNIGSTQPTSASIELRPPGGGWRLRLYRVIYESDTRAGRAFDVLIVGRSAGVTRARL